MLYFTAIAFFNLMVGYSVAVCLGYATWCPWRDRAAGHGGLADSARATISYMGPFEDAADPDDGAHCELAINNVLIHLNELREKFQQLRADEDSAGAAALGEELNTLVRAQLCRWQHELKATQDAGVGENEAWPLLQRVSQTETTVSNLDAIDWKEGLADGLDAVDANRGSFLRH